MTWHSAFGWSIFIPCVIVVAGLVIFLLIQYARTTLVFFKFGWADESKGGLTEYQAIPVILTLVAVGWGFWICLIKVIGSAF